jgi:cytidyltransferase-like protein
MNQVIVSGSFDDLRSRQVRFLEEASRLGMVHVLLWADGVAEKLNGQPPKFPQAERQYFLEAIRFVSQVTLLEKLESADILPAEAAVPGSTWAVLPEMDSAAKRMYSRANAVEYRVISEDSLQGFPSPFSSQTAPTPGRKKVIVTGCYDWLHTGHVRFFEEVSGLGDLYVVVGSDENVRLLKGEGHPLFREEERRYMVGAVRYVTSVDVSTGSGWMDAEPEIARIQPDVYAVNEDGDKPEKRAFCAEHGLEYSVLKRLPKEGLPRRESTNLRGF